MKILLLTRYNKDGASSRLRFYQYIPFIVSPEIEVTISPLFGNGYVNSINKNSLSLMIIAKGYIRRLHQIFKIHSYDIVWLEAEACPWMPIIIERIFLKSNVRLIVDYDDAIFHRYNKHRSWVVRKILGNKIDKIMARAQLITVGNEYLANHAFLAGCKRCEWLPTVIDLDRYPLVPRPSSLNKEVIVGWIGSPSTAIYLNMISNTLFRLSKLYNIKCIAIGAREDQVVGTPFECFPWDIDTEINFLRRFDIGIMPLPNKPWERGKCGYKLIQYMACELPVVASPVGVNRKIVSNGINGFLADSPEEWFSSLSELIQDHSLRKSFGVSGRQQVERIYSLQIQAPRLLEFIHQVDCE